MISLHPCISCLAYWPNAHIYLNELILNVDS